MSPAVLPLAHWGTKLMIREEAWDVNNFIDDGLVSNSIGEGLGLAKRAGP
jgi:hypothetical protein